ncbi:LysR family transcriptional regulator [Paraburkholderia phosphatilytica]|uniref:LysR family transcriptional regulator n=1 Tax=Paraburkholderia phosphatilytica TaxID=2282883 RepID=UPI001F0C4E74|nr:LysR family transcriptional regulator [Paraburkholderia phosphatilytica]
MFLSMRIFVQIVELGSFTKAASALQLHRPVATKAVQHLEQTLGVRLLHRTTRRITLTAEGEEFYQRCAEILSQVSDTVGRFAQRSARPRGRLRLDLPVTIAKTIIIPALPAFQRQYPEIELVIGARDQYADIVGEGIDCAVRLGEVRTPGFVARKIAEVPMVTCASPEYLDQSGTPRTVDDLHRHVAVNFFYGPERKIMDWRFFVDGEEQSVKMRSGILANDSEAFLASGLAGFGILQGVLPALQPYIDSGRLVRVLPDTPSVPKIISVVYPARRHLPSKVKVFIDWLTHVLSQAGINPS